MDFIVLGLVPGTQIQLNFANALAADAIIGVLVLVAYEISLYRHRPVRASSSLQSQ